MFNNFHILYINIINIYNTLLILSKNNSKFYNNLIFFNKINFNFFNLFLITTTLITIFICLITADNKYFFKNKTVLVIFLSLIPIIILLTLSKNILTFFIFYEMLLVPSFLLLKYSSINRRIDSVSKYFLFWTQLGSFIVLIGLVFLFKKIKTINFFSILKIQNIPNFIKISIFTGFGVKVPLWPFHFWLSKTHVEANTNFSIFLSGILVKSAVFGLYKFYFIFFNNFNWFFLSIIFISILDASIKMCNQVDLKKLVAFSTIQEMGILLLFFVFFNKYNYIYMLYFFIFHTLISGVYFYIVDLIYKKTNTRINYNISGLSNTAPKLSIFIITFIFIFIGIPFTIKFYIEFFLVKILIKNSTILLVLILFIGEYIGVLFFFKNFISINYGSIKMYKIIDLSKKEFFTLIIFLSTFTSFSYL